LGNRSRSSPISASSSPAVTRPTAGKLEEIVASVLAEELVDTSVELTKLDVEQLKLVGEPDRGEAVTVDAAGRTGEQVGAEPLEERLDRNPSRVADAIDAGIRIVDRATGKVLEGIETFRVTGSF
jgi:hypothetical protein